MALYPLGESVVAPSPGRTLRRLLLVLLGFGALVVVAGAVGVVWLLVSLSPTRSLPARLTARLHPGMSLREVEQQARSLGFAWRVNESLLEKPRRRAEDGLVGRIICQLGSDSSPRYVCEDDRDAKHLNPYFSSYACLIDIKGGRVKSVSFYMD